MRRKSIRKVIGSLCISIAILLAATGCGGPPVLGQEVKDSDAFEQCSVEKIDVKEYTGDNLEDVETKEFSVIVPKGEELYSTDSNASASKSGVAVKVEAVQLYNKEKNSAKKILQEANKYDIEYFAEAKSQKIKKINDGAGARVQTFAVKYNEYSDVYTPQCITSCCLKVAADGYIKMEVVIDENKTDKNTDKVIEELENFYLIDIYRDAKRAKKTNKEYKENPPTTKSVSEGSVNFSIPKSWKKVDKMSTYPITVYAANGNFTQGKGHIVSYHSFSDKKVTEIDSTTKATLEKSLGATGIEFKKIDTKLKDAVVYNGAFTNEGVTLKGYYIFTDHEVTMIAIMYAGSPSAAEKKALEDAFNSVSL